MNERIQELMKQSMVEYQFDMRFSPEKFAELIVAECKENFAKVWYEQGLDIHGAELGKFLTRFEEHFGVEE
jgi:spore coat polysaccharide biosynthesis protein SpsF (cytidylyltransferase family)